MSSSSTAARSAARFTPGEVLAGRYRIVSLLGRGGMGEVYRAEDLTLGQTVALKFLPESLTQDDAALARFYNEVRIARQVSHPNVCRVYDLGQWEGQTYLSMEYVDGEDLGALLRRIGRLPADKGIEIARKLCAGLAAAHDKGVLHRDLKPSNIMLDARGQVLITDFGLAGLSGQIRGAEVRNGTPAYMAPEQLAGREVGIASDLYSLGLVLYEMFTGQRAFEAASIAELVRLQTQSRPPSMTTVARDLDPAVERVILRCLDPEPQNRPRSALAVAAALPGGDPLAAALAAGETPSPQMVAAAGESTFMQPRVAIACLAAVVAGLVMVALFSGSIVMVNRIGLDLPPDVLREKATELLRQAGYTARPQDWAHGFVYARDFLDYVEKNDGPRPDWDAILRGQPSPVTYWYRQSQDYLKARDIMNEAPAVSGVTRTDPPMTEPGMIRLELDPQGRLLSLLAIPPEWDPRPYQPQAPDWTVLLKAAGLDASRLKPAEPQWNSLAASDTWAAWTGSYPGGTRRLRVEVAAWRGKPVFFRAIGPWTEPLTAGEKPRSPAQRANEILFASVAVVALGGALFLSWWHHRAGRGDARGALRLSLLILGTLLAVWMFGGHHLASTGELQLAVLAFSHALFLAAVVWVLYMALEPFVRRRWPQTLISWSRLLSGRLRDPLVGRDILYGLVLAMIWATLFAARFALLARMGGAPNDTSLEYLVGPGAAFCSWLIHIPKSVQSVLVFFFLLFGLRALLRKQWLAVVAFVLLFGTRAALETHYPLVDGPLFAIVYGIAAVFLVRFGLVTLATGIFVVDVLINSPITLDASAWYFNTSLAILLSFLAMAAFAFHTALAGRPLLKEEWLA